MLGRTLRLPAPPGLPARPLPARDPPAARCPARSPPPVVTSSRGWGPTAAEESVARCSVLAGPGGERLPRGDTVGVKGREAGGWGAFSTGDGAGGDGGLVASGDRSAPPPRAPALARRPHLPWSRRVRGGGRWRCMLAGWLLLTSSTWKGEKGFAETQFSLQT